MLKRNLGRSLLGLLVITGLAGTIEDHSISKKERKQVLGMMKSSKEDVLSSVKTLSDAQLNFKPTANDWSIKECLYHIAASEKSLWELFEKNMKGPSSPEQRVEIKVTDEQFVQMLKDRSTKFKTRETLEPQNTGYSSTTEAVEDFKRQRLDHIKYLKNSTEDMRNHIVEMPWGKIDCYQLCLMIAAHTERHLLQINEVKANTGFPLK